MKYCKKCVMPDTRPGISFNEEGICSACQSYERRKNIDWNARWKEFETICNKYRGMNGDGPDCAIAVSGGKDSHYQVHLSATDYAARMVRFGIVTREQAVQMVKEHDGKLDPLCVRDFCEFCGYTETEFWSVVDKLYNRELFEKNEIGEWVLKNPVWEN